MAYDVPGGSATPGACCTSSMSGEAAARHRAVAHLSVQLGLRDIAGIRESLAECAGGGAAPFSVVATNRALLEAYRRDPAIDRLLDDLHEVRACTDRDGRRQSQRSATIGSIRDARRAGTRQAAAVTPTSSAITDAYVNGSTALVS